MKHLGKTIPSFFQIKMHRKGIFAKVSALMSSQCFAQNALLDIKHGSRRLHLSPDSYRGAFSCEPSVLWEKKSPGRKHEIGLTLRPLKRTVNNRQHPGASKRVASRPINRQLGKPKPVCTLSAIRTCPAIYQKLRVPLSFRLPS